MWDVLLDILFFLLTGKKRNKDGEEKKEGEEKIELRMEDPAQRLKPGAEIVNLKKEYGPVRCSNCGKQMKTQAIRDLRAFWCPKCYQDQVLKHDQKNGAAS
jgi:NAD-dependent SIR2 family protein deacetylase